MKVLLLHLTKKTDVFLNNLVLTPFFFSKYNVVLTLAFTSFQMFSADVKACGIEGRSCYQKMGVLRVSLGCFVSFSVKSIIIFPPIFFAT